MEKLGIYIHVPFCQSKCLYCDFASWSGYDHKKIAIYFDRLMHEIRAFSKKNGKMSVGTIYFGGGTPSYVDCDLIDKVMTCIVENFTVDLKSWDERTIEMNPASLTTEKALKYKHMGFNRVSVGLQATQDQLLHFLGRPHNWSDFISTYTALKEAGINNVSADLMFGLPTQTLEDVAESVTLLTEFENIKHISAYSLKVEEGTSFYEMQRCGKLELPEEEMERQMQHLLSKMLSERGFEQYELSNFAKPGFKSRHNRSYWEMKPYVGFGLGAASYFKGRRWTNTFDMNTYLGNDRNDRIPVSESHVLDKNEMKSDFMFLGLRKTGGVYDCDYEKMFGTSFFIDYKEAIEKLVKRGLLMQNTKGIYLTSKGQDYANQAFVEFI